MNSEKRKIKSKFNLSPRLCVSAVILFVFTSNLFAQIEQPPAPSAPRAVKIPPVQSKELANGLTIATVERKNVPLVTISLLIRSGAAGENKDGLANMTAELLTKGTRTRTATQIAEQMEFLGGNLRTSANWNATVVSVNVASDKLEQALAIMSDVVLHPMFAPKEIALYKSQTIDDLNVALKQPSNLANAVANRYTFGEHNAIGTPESLSRITRADVAKFYRESYLPDDAILIFAGDVSNDKANILTKKFFGAWKNPPLPPREVIELGAVLPLTRTERSAGIIEKILVVDLPDSGQAAVTYTKKIGESRVICLAPSKCENAENYFPAIVGNTILGGGYSARLNQEIRIKRGLSYGAGSGINWRWQKSNFATRTQTKNISAAEVAELVATEIGKLGSGAAETPELIARKLTLTGDFGRDLETTDGLAERLIELYTFGIEANTLNSYMTSIQNVSAEQIKKFASENLNGGDIIIVGDAKIFMDDLKKRFPGQQIEIIAASDLDLNREDLRKVKLPAVKPKAKGK